MKEDEENIIKSKNHIYKTSSNSTSKAEFHYQEPKKDYNVMQQIFPSEIELKLPGIDYKNQNKYNKKNDFSTQYPFQNLLSHDKFSNNFAKNFNSFELQSKLNVKQIVKKLQNATSPKSIKNPDALEKNIESGIFSHKTKIENSIINSITSYNNLKISKELDFMLESENKKQKQILIRIEEEFTIKPEYFVSASDIQLIKELEKPEKLSLDRININKKQETNFIEVVCKTHTDGRSTGITMQDFGTQISFKNEIKLLNLKTENEALNYADKINSIKKLTNKESILNNYNFYIGSLSNNKQSDINNIYKNYINNYRNTEEEPSTKNKLINQNEKNDKCTNFTLDENLIKFGIKNLNTNNLINFNKFYNQNKEFLNFDLLKKNKIKENSYFSPMNISNFNETLNLKSTPDSIGKIRSSTLNKIITSKFHKKNSEVKNYMNQKEM